jgi:triacylglycerol esterase/lipase EstA (alpha/beta hydrolase family)
MARSRVSVLIAVLVVAVVTVPLAVRLAGREAPARRTDGGALPVLLVPGYGGDPASLSSLRAALAARGLAATVVALPGQGRGDLRASARVLAKAVAAAGSGPVDLVGYSAGGIVVRLYLAELGGAARVRHVVMLGTPNHGTTVAGLGVRLNSPECSLACRQLAPGSELLDRLDRDETPAGPDYLTVWTSRDETVTPPGTAKLKGAFGFELQSICPDTVTSHAGLPRDPLATGLVARALTGGRLEDLGEGDCGALRAGPEGQASRLSLLNRTTR